MTKRSPSPEVLSLLPYKSVAGALLLSVALGAIGLLYASFWAGLAMIVVGLLVVNTKLLLPMILLWLISCIWSVGAVEFYNKKILYQFISTQGVPMGKPALPHALSS